MTGAHILALFNLIFLLSFGSGDQAPDKGIDSGENILIRPARLTPVLAAETNTVPQPAANSYPVAPPKQLPTVPPIMTPQSPSRSPIQPAIIPQPRPTLVKPRLESTDEPAPRTAAETPARNEPPEPIPEPRPAAELAALSAPVQARPRPIPQPETPPPLPVLEAVAVVALKPAQPAPGPRIEPPPPAAERQMVFDPQNITKETFDATKAEVEAVIKTLNSINQRRDYQAWLKYLDGDYREKLSSPEFLENQSKQPRLASQKIVLSNLRDYFIHVFIPARRNARVDTIEFDDQKKVKVIAINRRRIRPPTDPNELERIQPDIVERTRDGWLILNEQVLYYELEKTDNGWKIIDFIN
jgi:hypothetical protein